MSLLQTAKKCSELNKAPKGVVYGPPGVGKTTFGANSNKPIIILCESGTSERTCPNSKETPYLTDWPTTEQWLTELATTDHEYATVVVDSLDWMLRRIEEKVAGVTDKTMGNTMNRSHGGYGNGRQVMHNYIYQSLLPLLDKIVNRGVAVVLLSHSSRQTVTGNDGIASEKTTPDLPKDLLNIMIEWSDFVGAAAYAADGSRVLILNETPQLVAKKPVRYRGCSAAAMVGIRRRNQGQPQP